VTPREDTQRQLDQAVELFRSSRSCVVFTGAGLSVPSGIPDFRSAGTGLWNRFDPMEVASFTAFRRRPEAFFNWLQPLAVTILNARPNPAHLALASLQKAGRVKTIITQNIDRLHQMAGATDVIELHGNVSRLLCFNCRREFPLEEYRISWLEGHQLPRCTTCQALLKPDIVLYEEMLPMDAWEQAEAACRLADLIFIAGTSLEVFPASSLPMEGYKHGAAIVIMNLSPTPMDGLARAVIPLDVAEGLPLLAHAVTG
jgi:NAD-dependent deacetylase